MEAVEALERLGGIARAADVVALSSRRRLRTAVAHGAITRVSHDRYALPVADLGKRLAIEHDAHLTHLSAALHHGWEVRSTPAVPQLLLPPTAPAPSARASFWWYDARHDELDGWSTAPLLTVLLCARDLLFGDALTVADSALRHQDVTYEELVAAGEAWHGSNREQVLAVTRHANGLAANPFESALRAITIDAGFEFVPQYEVRAGALVLHPDLVDPLHGVVLEADSWGYHADKEAHERDCRRYTMLTATGWRVLRFTYDEVMFQPEYVRAAVERVMAEATAA